MTSTECALQLHIHLVQVTSDDIQRVYRLFEQGGRRVESDDERLVLDIMQKLQPLIGKIKKEDTGKHKLMAAVVKILTENRTPKEAREHLGSDEGANWLRQVVASNALAPTAAPETESTDATPENTPTVAVESDEAIVVDGHVSDVPQLTRSLSETSAIPPQELAATTTSLRRVEFIPSLGPIYDQILHNGQIVELIHEQPGRNPESLSLPTALPGRQQISLLTDTSRPQRLDLDPTTVLSLRIIAFSVFLIAVSFSADIFLRLLWKLN